MTSFIDVSAGREHMRLAYAECNALSTSTDGTYVTYEETTYVQKNLTLVNVRGRRKGEYNVSNGNHVSALWRRLWRGVHQPANRRAVSALRAAYRTNSGGAEEMKLAETESDFQRRVMDTARLFGWRRVHIRPARTDRGWRTPYEGDSGLPDLVLAKCGRVILVELKSDAGKPSLDQLAWLDAAGPNGYLWAPRDWDRVLAVLGAIREPNTRRPASPPADVAAESAPMGVTRTYGDPGAFGGDAA